MKKIKIFPKGFDPKDDYTKKTSLIWSIQQKIKPADVIDEHIHVHKLEDYEKNLYCLERLSQQCNVSGFQSFFDYHVSHLYAEILEALGVIKASQMEERLRELKRLLLGDAEVTQDNVGDVWWPFDEDFESREAEEDFHKKLQDYAVECFNKEGFVLVK